MGENPYYLSCQACRWDSKIVSITFEKPTGIAAQLQKMEDGSRALSEFDRIKDYLEPYLRRGLLLSQHSSSVNPSQSYSQSYQPTFAIAAAARALSTSSSTMLKDIPSSVASANRFNSLNNLAAIANRRQLSGNTGLAVDGTLRKGDSGLSLSGDEDLAWKDNLKPYRSQYSNGTTAGKGHKSVQDLETARTDLLRGVESIESLSTVKGRCMASWEQAYRADDLRPRRVPLHSKRTKRCAVCRHIVVKVRYPTRFLPNTKSDLFLITSHNARSLILKLQVPNIKFA